MKTIVVLGAGLAAVPLIRALMRTHVLPSSDVKLVVVAPNTHFHFAIAMPRVVAAPGILADDKAVLDLEPFFNQYPASKFERILGKAIGMEPGSNSVTVEVRGGGERRVLYDVLVVATGSSDVHDMPWKVVGDTSETKKRLRELQGRIKASKSVVVVGGGATGTEMAGELGSEYGQSGVKDVYFVYSGPLPFSSGELESVREFAASELEKLKVKLIPDTKVVKAETAAGSGETTLELRNKEGKTWTLKTGAYLPAMGLTPNTAWMSAAMLDNHGLIKQTNTLQAQGHPNIFVAGDAGSLEASTAQRADAQQKHLAKAVPAFMAGEPTLPKYKPSAAVTFGATLGRSRATGQMGGWRLPSLMVWWFKGRHLFTDQVHKTVEVEG